MRLVIAGTAGLGLRISAEAVYWLEQPDRPAVVVPKRVSVQSSPINPARARFRLIEPDRALDVLKVREGRALVGHLEFMSRWAASP